MEPLIQGMIVGVALAAPVGPVGVICIQRALTLGRWSAVTAGLGAAVADAIFGAVAGLGLVLVQAFVETHQMIFTLAGVAILVWLGVGTWRKPASAARRESLVSAGLAKDFVTTFSLAIVNPATMFAAFGLFAAFGPVDAGSRPIAAGLLVSGVFLGSAAWWLFLSSVTVALRQHMLSNIAAVNKGSAILLFVFALILAARLLGESTWNL